jgi:hypothetical protein
MSRRAGAATLLATLALFLAACPVGGREGVRADRAPVTILVCIPTMPRRSGASFFAQALASVRQEHAMGAIVKVLVMHDSDDKPGGGDYYVVRRRRALSAPCKFVLWRRSLVLDFIDMMDSALGLNVTDVPRGAEGGGAALLGSFQYVVWLEDDAVLHKGWSAVLSEGEKLKGCMTALHPCNCHSCTDAGWYNGVGMVASVFRRAKLASLLPLMKQWPEEGALTPLDTMIYELCGSPDNGLGQGHYMSPWGSLATHQGNIVKTTTKPDVQTRITMLFPTEGQLVYQPHLSVSPLEVHFVVTGLVYDAEFSWTVHVSSAHGNQTSGRSQWKIASPTHLGDCSDAAEASDSHFCAYVLCDRSHSDFCACVWCVGAAR